MVIKLYPYYEHFGDRANSATVALVCYGLAFKRQPHGFIPVPFIYPHRDEGYIQVRSIF